MSVMTGCIASDSKWDTKTDEFTLTIQIGNPTVLKGKRNILQKPQMQTFLKLNLPRNIRVRILTGTIRQAVFRKCTIIPM